MLINSTSVFNSVHLLMMDSAIMNASAVSRCSLESMFVESGVFVWCHAFCSSAALGVSNFVHVRNVSVSSLSRVKIGQEARSLACRE